jgi:hypothetical protein
MKAPVAFALLAIMVAAAACQKAEAPVAGEPDPALGTEAAQAAVAPPPPAEEPSPAEPVETPSAAIEPGRSPCGPLTFALPDGSQTDVVTGDDGTFTKGAIDLPDETRMEVHLVAGPDIAEAYGADEALQRQVQTWLDSLGPQLADEWTPEITLLESPTVRGYYTVAKSELSGQPGKAYALNGFFLIGGHVVSIGGLHNDDSGAVNEAILDVIRSAEWAGS